MTWLLTFRAPNLGLLVDKGETGWFLGDPDTSRGSLELESAATGIARLLGLTFDCRIRGTAYTWTGLDGSDEDVTSVC